MDKTYKLHDILAAYSLHTYALDRDLDEEEAHIICNACELIMGESLDKWLSEREAEKRKDRNRKIALKELKGANNE